MIDESWIESINGECDELVSEGLGHYLVSNEAGAIRALIIRLRQAEKDAARYRWLRHMAEVDGAAEMMLAILISDDWDSAIDEAVNGSNNSNAQGSQ